ncbi:MAG: hypothetical protein GWO87_02805 [Xanthomonadaceae bacterium]|nr:hypothetical protein [Rhodospirillaceae bacterium]NIA18091.1 hypothetical protein [Xanthomonadaceae bacterium]
MVGSAGTVGENFVWKFHELAKKKGEIKNKLSETFDGIKKRKLEYQLKSIETRIKKITGHVIQ